MEKIYWLWRRLSDFCTSADVLEWFGWKAMVATMLASLFTTITTSLGGAPWYESMLAGFAVMLIALGIANLYHYLKASNKTNERAGTQPKILGIRLPDGFIPLHEAVDKLHMAAKQGKIPMMGAETMSGGAWDKPRPGSEEDIYTWWAIRVAKDDEIEMRGRRPPGDMERIGKRVKNDFLFVDKATRLKDPIHDEVFYTDLCVNRDALEASYYLSYGFHQD